MVFGLWSSHGAALPEDWQAYRSAQARAAEVEKADPRAAIGAWYAIFKERPKLDAWVGVLACSELIRLHYERVKDTKTALELCDWALKQYAGSPALARTVADKASVLLREGRPEEAEAAVAAHWDLVTRSYYAYSDAAVRQRFLALEGQGKAAEAEELLARALKEIPQLLDEAQQNPKGWIYNRLVHALVARQRADEALSWAKARFVTCRYDPAAMERSGRALVGAWSAKDPTRKDARAFLAALRTPNSALSTQHSALPPVDQKSVAEILTRVQGGAQPTHDRISLHLLVGNVREAFLEARRLLVDNPDQPAGTLELCRVLKALELSPARANALVAYLKEGTGADPLPETLRPLGITPEALPAAVRAGQRAALANTPLVPGDALAEKLCQGAPIPETVAAAGLPAALPVPVPTDPAALSQAAPAHTAAGAAAVPPTAIPMPMPAKVEVALPAWAAPPGTAPVAAAPVAAAPAGRSETPAAAASTVAATTGIAMPAPVREDLAAVTMALTRLQAGEITPETAWQEGRLTADDIIRALEALPIWGQDTYANALASLLVAHSPERIRDTTALTAKLRACLARYYARVRDPQCVSLYESLINDTAQPGYMDWALTWLPEYYKAVGDNARAALACLDAERRARNPSVRGLSAVEAARLYTTMGEDEKAAELYRRVAEHGYGWATGLAAVDRALGLIQTGDHQGARALLQRPVQGKYADQIQVVMGSVLAYSYYLTGEFAAARRYSEAAVAQYAGLQNPLRGDGLEAYVDGAKRCLAMMQQWEAHPLVVQPERLVIMADGRGGRVARRFTVSTHHRVDISANVTDARVKVIPGEAVAQRGTAGWLVPMAVEINADTLTVGSDAVVTLSSPSYPGCEVRLVVRTEVRPPISSFPKGLVFDASPNARQSGMRDLTLSGPRPFRILRVETDPSVVQVRPLRTEAASEHHLSFRLRTLDSDRQPLAGSLRVVTDIPGQEALNVEYVTCP